MAIWVKAKKDISFPKYNWGINAGEKRELPTFSKKADTEEARERILADPDIEKTTAPAEPNKPE